jgi:predicted DCC family thiol-disulfide oxidoreductase YuxK
VFLYDAECRLCRLAARAVVRLDRDEALAVLPLRDEEAAALLAPLSGEERLASWRFVAPGGEIAGEGAGVPELLLALRLTRPLGHVVRLVPAKALDAAYRLVARHRGRLGQLVPDGQAPRRFP